MTTVVVGGAIANKAGNGGESWVRLSWAEGLRRLGLDVWLVEEIGAGDCAGPDGRPAGFPTSFNRSYFAAVAGDHGWGGRAALVCVGTGPVPETWGLPWPEVAALVAGADLVLNISGNLRHPALRAGTRCTAYVDLDPGYTQIWDAQGKDLGLDGHHRLFTVGTRIGSGACPVPTGGRRWRPVRQPVVLEDWPVVHCELRELYTTVGSWRGAYGPVEHDGRQYGVKAHQFRRLAGLPALAPGRYEVALAIDAGDERDRDLLCSSGWTVIEPSVVAGSPAAFRSYVQRSGAEISAAQGVYVGSACGWFSDRSVRYLASGRPVVVQDTGFGTTLPVGEGLLAFADVHGAAGAVARVGREWTAHAEAARYLAARYFAHDVVLPPLLDACGVS